MLSRRQLRDVDVPCVAADPMVRRLLIEPDDDPVYRGDGRVRLEVCAEFDPLCQRELDRLFPCGASGKARSEANYGKRLRGAYGLAQPVDDRDAAGLATHKWPRVHLELALRDRPRRA